MGLECESPMMHWPPQCPPLTQALAACGHRAAHVPLACPSADSHMSSVVGEDAAGVAGDVAMLPAARKRKRRRQKMWGRIRRWRRWEGRG